MYVLVHAETFWKKRRPKKLLKSYLKEIDLFYLVFCLYCDFFKTSSMF